MQEPLRPTAQTTAYRPDIDGLRGVAVLGVVLFHALPNWLPSGFIGVDIFFVISGYLITSIIAADLVAKRFRYRTFYVRRIRRIFPALSVVLLAVLGVGWFKLFPDEFVSLGRQLFGGAAFVANIVLWQQTGYFDAGADQKPLLHLWSLGVEEQFYIVWPTLVALLWNRWYRSAVVVTMLAASFALNVFFITRSPDATFYLPITRFWELLLGALVALASVRHSDVPLLRAFSRHWTPNAVAWSGVLLLGTGFVLVDQGSRFPGWWALLPTLGTTLLIVAGPDTWPNRQVLANRLLVAIGLISYPLYLWHWPLLVFQRVLRSSPPNAWVRLATVLASLVLASLTYVLIERPIRFGRRRPAMVPALCAAMAAAGVVGLVVYTGHLAPRSAQGDFQKIWDATADWSPYPGQFHSEKIDGLVVRALGDEAAPHVLFLGDSNIEQFGPRIERVVGESPHQHKPVFVAAVGGCPPIPNVREDHHPDCSEFLTKALTLAASDRVDRVVVGACWNCYLRQDRGPTARFRYFTEENGTTWYLNDSEEADRRALAALQSMLASLVATKRVYLLLNVPTGAPVDPKEMIRRDLFGGFVWRRPVLSREGYLKDFGELRQRLVEVATGAGATPIDPFDVLCPDATCPSMTDDGRPIYRDADHLRPFYVRERAGFIDETLRIQ